MSDVLASRHVAGDVPERAKGYALVRTQGHTVAVPSHCVTQAVEAPGALTPLPRRAGAIEGVMTLGSRVLPVVSLARWLEPAAAVAGSDADAIERANGLVLLLKEGDQCIGLAVEAVVGVQKVLPAQVCRLFHDEQPEELFQSAALFGGDATAATPILEPRRLMALAGVWVAEAKLEGVAGDAAADLATERMAQHADSIAHATFRIADAHVALPASHVGELLREPRLRHELLHHDGVQGLVEWRGRQVPVVDLTGALHALPDAAAAAWVCIVCQDDLAIGVVVHEVLGITRVANDAGTPDTSPETDRAVIGRRLVTGDRTLQVMDVAALMRRYPEAAISSKGRDASRAARQAATGGEGAPAYMVFDAGGRFAARIDGVQEVVALPDDLRLRLDAGLSTTLQWREQPVPVLPIGDSLVTLPADAVRQLVIVRQEGRLAALTIAGVRALVPRGVAQRNRMRLQGRAVEVISVETEDHRASYTVVDLFGGARSAA